MNNFKENLKNFFICHSSDAYVRNVALVFALPAFALLCFLVYNFITSVPWYANVIAAAYIVYIIGVCNIPTRKE